jgi:cytochrome c553
MNTTHLLRAAVLFASAFLLACGGAATGDAERGRQLYNGERAPLDANSDAPRCIDCHPATVGGQVAIMGNNLSNIGNRAAQTVPGQDAQAYLREAILEPDKYLAGGFQEGIHYREYSRLLSDQDVEDLIAYMLTLRSGVDE